MKTGKVRIIGGKWKGKKILFNLDSNLRPTPDRAKEMIFNWLGQDLFDFTIFRVLIRKCKICI